VELVCLHWLSFTPTRGDHRKFTVNLKNYTSTVPVEKTLARIEQKLAEAGAASVSKEYSTEAKPVALHFKIEVGGGKYMTVRLPADAGAVYEALKSEVIKPHNGTLARIKEQAGRTAWKLMQDWVEVQVSLIRMQKSDPREVFLPYIWNGRETFFQQLKGNNFKALPEKTD